jgi:hypothetical protein
MELNVHKHRATLTQADHEANDKRSQKSTANGKLNANFIGVSIKQLANLIASFLA